MQAMPDQVCDFKRELPDQDVLKSRGARGKGRRVEELQLPQAIGVAEQGDQRRSGELRKDRDDQRSEVYSPNERGRLNREAAPQLVKLQLTLRTQLLRKATHPIVGKTPARQLLMAARVRGLPFVQR
jgi:hypothetical protein